jgi:predicted PurR-regulated permease PerM
MEDLGAQASEAIKPAGAREQVDFVIRPNVLRTNHATTSAKLLTLTAVVVVIAGLYFGRQVLIPLALAVVLSFLLAPVASWLETWRLGRVLSVVVVISLALALVGIGGWMVSGQLMNVVDQLPSYQSNIHDKVQSLRVQHGNRLTNATKTVSDLSKELTAASESAADKKIQKRTGAAPIPVQVTQPPGNAPQYLRTIVGPLTGVLETTVIVIVFAVFMLVKREDLRNRLIRLAGQGRLTLVTQALDDASRRLSRYLYLQFLVNTLYGAMFGGGLYLIGVPHPLLWGVLAALLRLIPYIGTTVAAGFPALMAMAVFSGWHQALLVVALFVTLEIIVSNALEPWLYGSHTGISSLAILVAAVFWAALWGPIGLILSTPLTVCLILMGRYVPQLNFLEVLLGDEPVLPLEAHFYQRLLALDQDEATTIAESYLKEKPLGSLYDNVVIPALAMAEQDRHLNMLDAGTADFISQSTRELIEEVGERFFDSLKNGSVPSDLSKNGRRAKEAEGSGERASKDSISTHPVLFTPVEEPSSKSATASLAEPLTEPKNTDADKNAVRGSVDYENLAGLRIVCIPARDEADELVAQMIAQLLRRLGSSVRVQRFASRNTDLNDLETQEFDVAIVSALPPFAAGHARSLCKRLRQRHPQLKIVVGLWSFEGGIAKAEERIGGGCADMLATSLEQAIGRLAEASPSSKPRERIRVS